MIKFIIGVIVGIYIATAGVSGLIGVADRGVDEVKSMAREVSK